MKYFYLSNWDLMLIKSELIDSKIILVNPNRRILNEESSVNNRLHLEYVFLFKEIKLDYLRKK